MEEDEEQREVLRNALEAAGDWSAHDDGDGRLFYYNRRSRESRWAAPEELSGLEGELMMKLMLEGAVARAEPWSAHDAGGGTLYYFNARSRESVWERPSDWGALPPPPTAVEESAGPQEEDGAESKEQKKPKKDKKKDKREKKKKKKAKTEEATDKEAASSGAKATSKADDVTPRQPEVQEEEVDPEELEEAKRREEAHMKQIAHFRALLREKNIMPFCRWSVALPQIATDPRFMVISTMDERREIFEHFVKHRREDLKVEKKQKLKEAKNLFSELLVEQLRAGKIDSKTTLSVFLSTLEDNVDADRLKLIKDESLAYLTLDVQEKLYKKANADFQANEVKRADEAKRLGSFLESKMTSDILLWEDPNAQHLVDEFYQGEAGTTSLLPPMNHELVFREVSQRLRSHMPQNDHIPSAPNVSDRDRDHQAPDDRRQGRDEDRGRERRRSSRSRSRSHSRRRHRDSSEEDDRSHRRSSRGRSRRSSSRSRSRSRSRRRHSRRRSYSSSRSRSRSRSHSRRRR